jgi:hypothetical protein
VVVALLMTRLLMRPTGRDSSLPGIAFVEGELIDGPRERRGARSLAQGKSTQLETTPPRRCLGDPASISEPVVITV